MPQYQPVTTIDQIAERIPDDTIAGLSLRGVVLGYLTAAEWCDINSDHDEQLPDDWQELWQGWTPATIDSAADDCRAFLCEVSSAVPMIGDYLTECGYNVRREDYTGDERFGHDFWLTRNGHGAGFWDRSELADPLPTEYLIIPNGHGPNRPDGSLACVIPEDVGDWLSRVCKLHGSAYAQYNAETNQGEVYSG